MIHHQIKTIEQAAELYQELVGKLINPASEGKVCVSDYKIEFVVIQDEFWCIKIVFKWGAETDTGFTVIHAEINRPWHPRNICLYGFECNRETILDAIGHPPTATTTTED